MLSILLQNEVLLLALFFLVALLYSSVGLGGGSSYLALLALFGLEYAFLRSAALFCNIVVVTGGTFIYWKNGHLDWKKILPLVLFSVPLAFLGGRIPIAEEAFFILLGIVLLAAAISMWFQSSKKYTVDQKSSSSSQSTVANAGIGGGIGFLAGLVGIGGGIFLVPVLHLLRWDLARKIAGTASFFILVNSIAGLAGQLSQRSADFDWMLLSKLLVAVFIGGQIGSRLGAKMLDPLVIRRWTSVLVFFVSLRILYKYFFKNYFELFAGL